MELVKEREPADTLPHWLKGKAPDDIYRSPLEIAWTFDYLMSGDKIEDLYRRAKQDQWNSDERLPWDMAVDPSLRPRPESAKARLVLESILAPKSARAPLKLR